MSSGSDRSSRGAGSSGIRRRWTRRSPPQPASGSGLGRAASATRRTRSVTASTPRGPRARSRFPARAFCRVPGYGTLGQADLHGLTAVTGDQNAALSLLFERLVATHYARASGSAIGAVEREVVRESFGGSRAAYLAALAQAHLSVAAARAALADEIRRAELEQSQGVLPPKPAEISRFYDTYPELLVRRVHVSPAAPWLGGRGGRLRGLRDGAGVRLLASPPAGNRGSRPCSGRTRCGRRARRARLAAHRHGSHRCRNLTRELRRARAFERWMIGEQRRGLDVATCRGDDLPEPAAIDSRSTSRSSRCSGQLGLLGRPRARRCGGVASRHRATDRRARRGSWSLRSACSSAKPVEHAYAPRARQVAR